MFSRVSATKNFVKFRNDYEIPREAFFTEHLRAMDYFQIHQKLKQEINEHIQYSTLVFLSLITLSRY